jgi:hypothetical protein
MAIYSCTWRATVVIAYAPKILDRGFEMSVKYFTPLFTAMQMFNILIFILY